MLNPVGPFALGWPGLINLVVYELLVFLIEFILVTTTLRWRLHESLYGRTALTVLTANFASFFLVPFVGLGITLLTYGSPFFFPLQVYFIYLILIFFIEYVVITGMFYGLNMLPEESQLSIMLILIPVVFLSNLLTLFLGIFPPLPQLY